MKYGVLSAAIVMGIVAILASPGIAKAEAASSVTTDVSQTIQQGLLRVGIVDSQGNDVTAPQVVFPAKAASFECRKDSTDKSNTATLGADSQPVYISVPKGTAPNGWALSLAATEGHAALWHGTKPGLPTLDYNDQLNGGCTSGRGFNVADANSDAGGMLAVMPSAAKFTDDCSKSCNRFSMSLGQDAYFGPTTDSITLLKATTNNPWQGTLTGVGLYQTTPAQLAADTYHLPMTLTLVAL